MVPLPTCPRCGDSLDPADSAPSHSGAVHPGCLRPEDAVAPLFDEQTLARTAPKYGGPPMLRYGPSLLLVAILAGALIALRHCH
ncbi:MAG: hypothetical protein Q8Q09_29640 [Deltaproteobacteria bacterium]|nr:hypothetical protein [Deltaproteobacteria bacterium]